MIKQATITLKNHKKYNFLFFSLLMLLFIILYLSNALILSLETLKTHPLISEAFTPFLKELIQNYQKMYQGILFVAFFTFSALCLGKSYARRKETDRLLMEGHAPLSIALVNLIESMIVFAYFIVIYFIFLLIFQSFFEKIVIHIHFLMSETITGFPYQLEKIIPIDAKEQLVVRMTNTKQIFEYLLYLTEDNWSRLFIQAYMRTIVGITGCFMSIQLLIPWLYATWKNKKS